MKYGKLLFLMLFTAIALSCASRPPAAVPLSEQDRDLFDLALLNIKTNTPLVKKHLETNKGKIIDDSVTDIMAVVIKGICLIDGNEFHVTYDIGSAVQNGETFRIPFSVENRKNRTSLSDELFWTPAEDGAGLLLSFDDHSFRNWCNNFDLFDRYGAKVTFFVTGSLDADGSTSQFSMEMPIGDFCAAALRRGHGLGYRSRSHIDLSKLSRRTFDDETVNAAAAFSAAGIPLASFAYPLGFSEPWMRTALAPVFPLTRGHSRDIHIYNQDTINSGYIVSKNIDNIIYLDDRSFENDIRQMLLVTKFSGGIIPLTGHIIKNGTAWGIRPKRLEYLLKTAAELKLKFYTFGEVAAGKTGDT
jgi:peptidoglycan/xylan/chitin deacetylase (PgdA/CDA1 family)